MNDEGSRGIVCGTDGSPGAHEASTVAAALAAHLGEPLWLVHADESLTSSGAPWLDEEAARLRAQEPRLTLETRAIQGFPDIVLSSLGHAPLPGNPHAPKARCIVLSALGSRPPTPTKVGRVTERTAARARIPVLVIHDPAPWLAWLQGARPLRILVGCDHSRATRNALRWTQRLGTQGPCEILLGHIQRGSSPRSRELPSNTTSPSSPTAVLDEESIVQRELLQGVRDLPWHELPRVLVVRTSGRRAPALARLAADAKVDLLVVGSRPREDQERLWSETVAGGVLQRATFGVACVPFEPSAKEATESGLPLDADEEQLRRSLESHPFLRGASDTILRRVSSVGRLIAYPKGARLLGEGEEADTLFLIEKGHVLLEHHVPGKGALGVESLRSGDILGLSWFVPPYRWQMNARALEPTRVVALDGRVLRQWMQEDAAVAQALALGLLPALAGRLERSRLQHLDVYKEEP